jgi:hypothetical protein
VAFFTAVLWFEKYRPRALSAVGECGRVCGDFPLVCSGIGWDFRHQYDRLHLIANNSRCLILPEYHYPNLASRVLAVCERRLAADWRARSGYSLLLLETFVDPRYFHGTIYA